MRARRRSEPQYAFPYNHRRSQPMPRWDQTLPDMRFCKHARALEIKRRARGLRKAMKRSWPVNWFKWRGKSWALWVFRIRKDTP